MREAIKILRKDLAFCTQLTELMESMDQILKERPSGNALTQAVKKLEQTLSEAPRLETEQKAFLEKAGYPDLHGFLEAQPASVEREMALRLWEQVGARQEELRRHSAANRLLLERSKEFIDFHINVISRARANPTYGPPGAGGAEQGGRRMFDQNV